LPSTRRLHQPERRGRSESSPSVGLMTTGCGGSLGDATGSCVALSSRPTLMGAGSRTVSAAERPQRDSLQQAPALRLAASPAAVPRQPVRPSVRLYARGTAAAARPRARTQVSGCDAPASASASMGAPSDDGGTPVSRSRRLRRPPRRPRLRRRRSPSPRVSASGASSSPPLLPAASACAVSVSMASWIGSAWPSPRISPSWTMIGATG